MQSRTIPGLQLFCSMPNMPHNKQRVQSASTRKEANQTACLESCPFSHTNQSPNLSAHWRNTINHPTNSNHPIISWIQHFPFFMDGAQLVCPIWLVKSSSVVDRSMELGSKFLKNSKKRLQTVMVVMPNRQEVFESLQRWLPAATNSGPIHWSRPGTK